MLIENSCAAYRDEATADLDTTLDPTAHRANLGLGRPPENGFTDAADGSHCLWQDF
jgi:hypothetical protein